MKIYMIGNSPEKIGGIATTVANLDEYFIKKGLEITNLCFGKENNIKNSSFGKIISFKSKGQVIDKTCGSFKVARKIKEMIINNEKIIVHGQGDFCLGYSLLRDWDIPFIMTFQGCVKASYEKTNYRKMRDRIVNKSKTKSYLKNFLYSNFRPLTEKIAAKKCDKGICISKSVKKEIQKFYNISSEKLEVIYHGVNSERFKPVPKKEARKKLGFEKDKNFGLWVGVQPFRKGLDIAIQSVKNLKHTKILVVGNPGPFSKNKYLKPLGVVNDRLNLVYNAADFFIFPSRYEPFGLVVTEALATGLPTIVSSTTGASEIMENREEGFVVDGFEPENYKKKVKYLLKNDDERKVMSQKGRKLAEKYSWEKQAQKYLDLYKKLTL